MTLLSVMEEHIYFVKFCVISPYIAKTRSCLPTLSRYFAKKKEKQKQQQQQQNTPGRYFAKMFRYFSTDITLGNDYIFS